MVVFLNKKQKKINLYLFQFFRGFIVTTGVICLAITLISGNLLALILGVISFIICCVIFSSSDRYTKDLQKVGENGGR